MRENPMIPDLLWNSFRFRIISSFTLRYFYYIFRHFPDNIQNDSGQHNLIRFGWGHHHHHHHHHHGYWLFVLLIVFSRNAVHFSISIHNSSVVSQLPCLSIVSMALNDLYCADVPLSNYSLTLHSIIPQVSHVVVSTSHRRDGKWRRWTEWRADTVVHTAYVHPRVTFGLPLFMHSAKNSHFYKLNVRVTNHVSVSCLSSYAFYGPCWLWKLLIAFFDVHHLVHHHQLPGSFH